MRKKAVILGATSDIAEAFAYHCAAKGFDLVLAARKHERLEPLSEDLMLKHNTEISLAEFDAKQYNTHQAFAEKHISDAEIVLAAFGYLGEQEKAENLASEAAQILEVNFNGAVSILEEAAKVLAKAQKGCIIGISSVAGDRGRKSNYFYGSAKAGFTAYLSGLRGRMLAHKVHVVTVKPGFVDTKMTEGMPLPGPITASAEQVAKDMFKAYQKKKNTLYTLWMWKWIMLIIKSIPEGIFKKMNL